MITALLVLLAACGDVDDTDGGGDGVGDDSGNPPDDSGTPPDDSGTPPDDSGTPPDDSADDSGCTPVDWYQDVDLDGYGTGTPTSSCDAPASDWSELAGDCDDASAAVNPDEIEICNAVDDDCDELVDLDDDSLSGALSAYDDVDGDGYGDAPVVVCDATGTSDIDGDCDDSDADVNPDASEICNAVDDDCDTLVDADDDTVLGGFSVYGDADGDGFGSAPVVVCDLAGTSDVDGDCDDADAAVNPEASEICNSIDDDCDLLVDMDDPTLAPTVSYPDADGDGHGDPLGTGIEGCPTSSAYAPNGDDCDDTDGGVYPGAIELCDDIQQDCATKGWTGDEGVATWYPSLGGAEDMTATMASGAYGAPALVEITDDGELVICDGTWYVDVEIMTPYAVVTGLHGSALTTLSGGDATRVIGIAETGANVNLRGLTMSEGNACYGSTLSVMEVFSCSAGGASASSFYDVELFLDDVRIEDNHPSLISLATVFLDHSTLVMQNSVIGDNTTEGLWGQNTPVSCTGSPSNDAGIWGNNSGVFLWNVFGTDPYPFESMECDFDGPVAGSGFDISIQTSIGLPVDPYEQFNFGDDASFSCDTLATACF